MVYRVYVEKKNGFDVEAQGVFRKLKNQLLIEGLTSVRLLNRYDVENIDAALFEQCKAGVFAEPQSDDVYDHLPQTADTVLAVCEYDVGDARTGTAATVRYARRLQKRILYIHPVTLETAEETVQQIEFSM